MPTYETLGDRVARLQAEESMFRSHAEQRRVEMSIKVSMEPRKIIALIRALRALEAERGPEAHIYRKLLSLVEQ